MSKKWKIIIFGGLGLGVIAAVLIYFFVIAGNAGSQKEKTDGLDKDGGLAVLSGTYVSGKDPKKNEIYFVNDGTQPAKGYFKNFTAELTIDGSLESAEFSLEVDVASIFTDNSKRDNSLRSDGYLNADKYPKVTFESTAIEKTDDGYKAIGTLNFMGKDWDFEFPFTYRGHKELEDGKELASFEGEFTFKQTNFGFDETSGIADQTKISFYTDMIKGGDTGDDEDFDEDMDFEDDMEFEDEDAPVEMPRREYDDKLDKVEEEAEGL